MHSGFLKHNKLGLSLIALTWLVFFWRILFGGQVYFLDDLKIIYYPLESAYAQAQQAWQMPAWSPYFGFGHPLLAWAQLGFFTPLHVLLRVFAIHPVMLLNISTVTYIAVGACGLFAFLKQQKLSQLPAALGAITFAFCGFTIGHLNHVNFYTATMLLPWLLLAVSTFIRKPTLARTALLAVIAALIPLSGQPQIALYTFIIASIFGIIALVINFLPFTKGESRQRSWREGVKVAAYTLLAAAIAFSLAAFAILPLREFLPHSDRADDLPIPELYEFSYPPSHLKTLLNPYFFGDHTFYTGAKNFQELAAYVGFLPLALAFGGLVWPTRQHGTLRLVSLLLILIAAALATGLHSPLYFYLVENHIWTSLAVPGRFVYFFDVGVAILAAVGLQALLAIFRDASRGRDSSLIEIKRPISNASRKMVSSAVGLIVVALTAANLIWWGWDYNPLTPRTQALQTPPFQATLQQYERDTGLPARLYSRETLELTGPAVKKTDPRVNFYPETDTERDLFLRNTQVVAQASSARWIGALSVASYRNFVDKFFANDREPFDGEGTHPLVRFRNLVNASGVTHLAQALPVALADNDPVLQSGYNLVQEARAGEQTLLRLYSNPQAFAKAYLVGTAIWESGGDQTRHALSHPDYDPAKLVYISGPKPPSTGALPNQEEPNPALIPTTELGNAHAEITAYTPTRIEISVTTETPAWLILTDSYTPEWRTFIDDAPAQPYIANTVFRAAQIPPGSHTVVFAYVSPAIQQAKWLTLIGLLAVAFCFAAPYFKRRVSSSVAS